MATLADSLRSSSARNITMRVRPDLSYEQQRYQGRLYWVVKDPVGLTYFRFQEEEYAILRMLDGNISLDEIKERFEEEFPPQKITVDEIQRFLGMLHQSGLIIADAPGQGHQLRKRRDKKKRKELMGKFTNVLAIRFKGIDPERLLNSMYPYVRFFFVPFGVFCCLTLMLSALAIVTVQFAEFQSRLPTFHQFFGPKNWLLLGVALGVTKIIHEFGHGLTCKNFGGECHEIGVLILVLTPCLYCNVSDSWMLPSKWHRAMIGAAGMYIELVLASIATWIWWFTEPTTTLNQLALSTMFVSSVSTLLFNANPLLRYDGYYILSDLVEIPNLRQKATKILNQKMCKWCLGMEEQPDPFLPQRNQWFFAVYTIAAVCYRWFIMFAILFFLNQVFEPYGLKIIGQLIALMAIFGIVVMPLWKVYKFFSVPGRIEKVKKKNMYATVAVLAAIIAAVLFVPLPYHVICPLEVQPREAEPIYVQVPGTIKQRHVKLGEKVRAGQPLLSLESVDAKLAVERLYGQLQEAEAQVLSAERVDVLGSATLGFAEQSPQALAYRDSLKVQLKQSKEEFQKLTITAPVAGYVLPPPDLPKQENSMGQLGQWSGTPFDRTNAGAFLDEGVLVCQIGRPDQLEAVLVIDQADHSLIHRGLDVEILLDNLPADRFEAKIDKVARDELQISPRGLSNKAGGELATETDASGMERPISTSYQASVPLDNSSGVMVVGSHGRAKIRAGYRSLGRRAWDYISRTFNFEL